MGGRDEEPSASVVLGVVIVCGGEVTERVFVGLTERFGAVVLRCPEAIDANEKEGTLAAEEAIEESFGLRNFTEEGERIEERDSIEAITVFIEHYL